MLITDKFAYRSYIVPYTLILFTASVDLLPVELHESLQGDLAGLLRVQLSHDDLDLRLAQFLLQLCGHVAQVVGVEEALEFLVDLVEDAVHVFACVPLVGLLVDHAQELAEVDAAALVLVEERHGLVDVVALRVVPVVLRHGLQQVARREHSVAVRVEGVEDVLPDEHLSLVGVVRHELARLELVRLGPDAGVGHVLVIAVWKMRVGQSIIIISVDGKYLNSLLLSKL